jgi:tRNA(Arg) A34 adenosine deaminase TadA
MTEKHKKFMIEAIKMAEKSVKTGGGPFGCVIVKNNKIIGRGMNRVTAHNDPTAHGEMVAIRQACKKLKNFQLKGCAIYTNSEPCPMCLGAIYWARPNAVYFANSKKDTAKINFDDNFIYKEIRKPYKKRKIHFEQIIIKEAKTAYKMWEEKEDKIKY